MLIASIIPAITLCFCFLLKKASGPYWQFPDPCYGYLSSSLTLFKGHSPTFNYQPGTTVEIFGALTIFLLNIGHSTADAVHRVLLNPDFYLNVMNISFVLLIFVTSLILGNYVYRQTNDGMMAVLSQLPMLSFLSLRSYSFYDYVLPVVTNVSPEPLLISVANLFNLFLFKLLYAKNDQEELWASVWLGVILGLGVATRLTFASYLLIPLIVCSGWRRFIFLGVSLLSCFLCTIPIIPHYAWIWHWITMLSTHVGEYGSGSHGFIDMSQFVHNWQVIFDKCTLFVLFGLVAIFFGIAKVIKNGMDRTNIFLLSTALGVLIQLNLVAKHYDEHYLAAAISLFSALFVLFYLSIEKKTFFVKAAIGIFMAFFIIQALIHALSYERKLSGYTKDAVSFNEMTHTKYPSAIFVGVFPMPMSNPEAALFWGNDRDIGEQDEVSALFPHHLAYFDNNTNDYGPYVSGIYSFKDRVWADDLIAAGGQVLFIAPKNYDFTQTPYLVRPLDQGKFAGSFLLVKSTEKEATALLEASIKFLQAGEYQKSFFLALKAKDLHYQPAGKVDFLLYSIYPHIRP